MALTTEEELALAEDALRKRAEAGYPTSVSMGGQVFTLEPVTVLQARIAELKARLQREQAAAAGGMVSYASFRSPQ